MTREPSTVSRGADTRPPQGVRIVVADDEPDILLTLAGILEDEGYEVYGFGTGREAVAAARMYGADVLIVDIQMPDMSGYDIARQARYNLRRRPLLIAVSGRWRSETDMLLSVAIGFDHYFRKPCDPIELVECIRKWTLERPPGE